jgi:hypothetical protein
MKIGTLVAALAGGIVMFLLGFLFFGYLFADFFRANTNEFPGLRKDPPLIWAIFLFNLVWAWLIAWVLDHWSEGGGWGQGAKVGAIIMFTTGLAVDLDFYAFSNMHKGPSVAIAHLAIVIVLGAVSGAVIGWVLGLFGRSDAPA